MKISNRNYPIIEKLFNNSLGMMKIYDVDAHTFYQIQDTFVSTWKENNEAFKSEITICSKNYIEAVVKSENKLIELYGDIMDNDISDFIVKGTYIIDDVVHMVNYETYQGSNNTELVHYTFTKEGVPISFYSTSNKKNKMVGWLSKATLESKVEDKNLLEALIINKFIGSVMIYMFKNFAQVETKILDTKSKTKDINCKYINETSLPITYLDSKWFTNLVKSDDFNVRGHFRLQPKKINGNMSHELIWINGFKKQGYTSKAKILN